MKHRFFVFLALLLFPVSVSAQDSAQPIDTIQTGSEVIITEPITRDALIAGGMISVEAPIAEDAYFFGGEVTITEPITGTLHIAGGTIRIEAPIAGDVLALGGDILLSSTIGGDVRIAGGTVRIEQTVAGNVALLGGEMILGPESVIQGSVVTTGGSTTLLGSIEGAAYIRSHEVMFNGTIGGDTMVRMMQADDDIIGADARFMGNFSYQSPRELADIPEERISGNVDYTTIPFAKKNTPAVGWFFRIVSLFGMLVVGLVLVTIAPKTVRKGIVSSIADPLPDVLWGIGVLIIVPLLALVLGITLIGIPLAVILFLIYGIALYCAQVVTGMVLGTYVCGLFQGKKSAKNGSLMIKMLIGVFVLWLVIGIPEIGWVLGIIATVWGMGIIIRMKRGVFEQVEG